MMWKGNLVRYAFLFASLAASAFAQEKIQVQRVYWPLVTDGQEYRRIAYPEAAGEIVVHGNTQIVLDAREAQVGYWPITRAYLSDVSQSSDKIEGSFEIVDENGKVEVVEQQPYLLWHPLGVGGGSVELIIGPKTEEIYKEYVRNARTAMEATRAFQRTVAEHHVEVEAWLKLAAQRSEKLPPPPPELSVVEPEPYRAFATEPELASVVNLEPGSYLVRIRASDGRIVPNTERRLTAIVPLRTGIGYVVRPEDRWTQPGVTFGLDQTIYSTGQSDFYVQPVRVAEFNAQHFSRVFRPQTHEVSDPYLNMWVPTGSTDDLVYGELILRNGGDLVAEIPVSPYRVRQLSGRVRGYEIEPFDAGANAGVSPDFSGIKVPSDSAANRISLTLGAEVPNSERKVQVVRSVSRTGLVFSALIPFALGLAVRSLRRRSRAFARPSAQRRVALASTKHESSPGQPGVGLT